MQQGVEGRTGSQVGCFLLFVGYGRGTQCHGLSVLLHKAYVGRVVLCL